MMAYNLSEEIRTADISANCARVHPHVSNKRRRISQLQTLVAGQDLHAFIHANRNMGCTSSVPIPWTQHAFRNNAVQVVGCNHWTHVRHRYRQPVPLQYSGMALHEQHILSCSFLLLREERFAQARKPHRNVVHEWVKLPLASIHVLRFPAAS
jgi:hypothetical protein